jgi:hypothetical protein
LAGYFAFKNSSKLFGTKSGTVSKIFAPLLGTSKGKNVTDINTVDNGTGTGTNNINGDANQNPSMGGGISSGGNPVGGSGGGSQSPVTPTVVPPFIPLPTPSTTTTGTGGTVCKDANGNTIPCINNPPATITQCSDGVDNDADQLMDIADPGCHSDFNENNSLSYDSSIDDESRKKDNSQTAVGGMCPDDPLVFTEDEKAELAVLLRQYYLLAPSLRIEDDVTLLDYDNQTNEELVKQATTLISDCKAQKARPGYTGPKEVKDNPYYQSTSTTVTSTGTGTTTTTGGVVTCIPGYTLINGVSYNQTNSMFANNLTQCTVNSSSGSSAPLMEACQANYVTIAGYTYNGSVITANLRPCLISPFPTTTTTTTSTTTNYTISGPQYLNGYGLYELMFNIW